MAAPRFFGQRAFEFRNGVDGALDPQLDPLRDRLVRKAEQPADRIA
jgi:hypothetical protein